MKRIITEKFIEWKEKPNHKPLLIRGARQVGKTFSVLEFGKNYFSGNIHNINFERNPEISYVFEYNIDSNRIISELELILNRKIVKGKDLLFFDEIQECPNALKSLRYFYEQNPDLHVIAAGSLIEFALQDISFPVGRIQVLSMYPLNFEEFLLARGKELIIEKLKKPYEKLSQTIIDIINNELLTYFIIGGMPECVKTFIDTNSFTESINIQSDLILTLRQDFSKYAKYSDKRCLNSVLYSVAQNVGNQIKYSHLAEDFSNPTIKKAYNLLETAKLFTTVKAASPAGIPLGANVSEKKFKSIFLDIGLLSNLNGFYSNKLIMKQKMKAVFNGMLAEQFVGQELRVKTNENLYYWSRDARGSNAEVDFLMEKGSEIFPIEVKSGKSGRLRSLYMLLDTFPNIDYAYVFNEDKYGELENGKIKFLPLFYAGFI